MSFLEHTQLQEQSCYKLIGNYYEYDVNVNYIENETFLGEFYQILFGPIMGGDRDVYYCFTCADKEYVLEDYYIEKYGIKFELM